MFVDIRRNTKKIPEESKKDTKPTPNNASSKKLPPEKPLQKGKSFTQKPPLGMNSQKSLPEKIINQPSTIQSLPNIPQKILENTENLIENSKNLIPKSPLSQKLIEIKEEDKENIIEDKKNNEVVRISNDSTNVNNIVNSSADPVNNANNLNNPSKTNDFRIKRKVLNNKLSPTIPSEEKIDDNFIPIKGVSLERNKLFQLQESKTLKFLEKNKKTSFIK